MGNYVWPPKTHTQKREKIEVVVEEIGTIAVVVEYITQKDIRDQLTHNSRAFTDQKLGQSEDPTSLLRPQI